MYAHPRQEPRAHAIPAPHAAPKPAAPSFSAGDAIVHKAFGPGVITKMTPMGGDFLIEIDFEKAGSKKLMLRAAALQMTRR